jgi:hypothetical protein
MSLKGFFIMKNEIGQRIKLIYTNDQYTILKPGDTGTVNLIDSMGTVFVKWDNGNSLGLLPFIDEWEIVE